MNNFVPDYDWVDNGENVPPNWYGSAENDTEFSNLIPGCTD